MADCDSTVCLFGCISLVPGLKRKVVSRVAFAPPNPPGYKFSGNQTLLTVADGTDVPMPTKVLCRQAKDQEITIHTVFVQQHDLEDISCLYFTNPLAKATILHSHGNSTDIGYMFSHYLEICQNLNVNLLAYDYTGYGPEHPKDGTTKGIYRSEPTEDKINTNIEAAFDFLLTRQEVPIERIILYGQSLGSAPSIHLAARHQKVGALIIQSGMKSGFTVMLTRYDKVPWFDSFRNVDHIKRTVAPTLIIHGIKDLEVPISHGLALYEAAGGEKEGWWVPDAGHNNIEALQRREYFRRLCMFLVDRNLVDIACSCLTPDKSRVNIPKMPGAIDLDGTYMDGDRRRSSLLIETPLTLTHKTKLDVERRHGRCRLLGDKSPVLRRSVKSLDGSISTTASDEDDAFQEAASKLADDMELPFDFVEEAQSQPLCVFESKCSR